MPIQYKKLITYYKQGTVESIDKLPNRAIVISIDGRKVKGKCHYCKEYIFEGESCEYEDYGILHTKCFLDMMFED
jgi:hypothetical protein